MALFDRLDGMTSRTVDTVNSIPFTFTPMKRTANGRPVYDDERAIVEGKGVLDLVDVDPALELGNRDRRGNDLRSLVAGSQPVLSVDRRFFPAAAGEPRQGDLVAFPGRPDLGEHQVTSTRSDGQARVEIRLTFA